MSVGQSSSFHHIADSISGFQPEQVSSTLTGSTIKFCKLSGQCSYCSHRFACYTEDVSPFEFGFLKKHSIISRKEDIITVQIFFRSLTEYFGADEEEKSRYVFAHDGDDTFNWLDYYFNKVSYTLVLRYKRYVSI